MASAATAAADAAASSAASTNSDGEAQVFQAPAGVTVPLSQALAGLDCRLVDMLLARMTDENQRMFLSSFAAYLRFKPTDFCISLEYAFPLLGFARKGAASTLATRVLTEGLHYCLQRKLQTPLGGICSPSRNNSKPGVGRPSEDIMLTMRGFRELCMAAETQRGKEVRRYYLAIEEVMHDYMLSEMEAKRALEAQLAAKVDELRRKSDEVVETRDQLDVARSDRDRLLGVYREEQCALGDRVYIETKINVPVPQRAYKVGNSYDMQKRKKAYQTHDPNSRFVHSVRCRDKLVLEKAVHLMLRCYRVPSTRESFDLPLEVVKEALDSLQMLLDNCGKHVRHICGVRLKERIAEIVADLAAADAAQAEAGASTSASGGIDATRTASLAQPAAAQPAAARAAEAAVAGAAGPAPAESAAEVPPAPPPAAAPASPAVAAASAADVPASSAAPRVAAAEVATVASAPAVASAASAAPVMAVAEQAAAPARRNPRDYEAFLLECFEQVPGESTFRTDAHCRYRLWSHDTTDANRVCALGYLDARFRQVLVYNPEEKTEKQAFQGLRMRPLPDPPPLPERPSDAELFLHERCVRGVTARAASKDLQEAFRAWKAARARDRDLRLTPDMKRELHARLSAEFLYAVVSTQRRTQAGFYGVAIRGHECEGAGKRINLGNRKRVQEIEASSGAVLREFESLTHAAHQLGITISALSVRITNRHNRNNRMYRYVQRPPA